VSTSPDAAWHPKTKNNNGSKAALAWTMGVVFMVVQGKGDGGEVIEVMSINKIQADGESRTNFYT
jgi:hypothetical protein